MNNTIIKKGISILIIFAILLNIIPNFGLLNTGVYAASSEAKMIARPGVTEFETVGENRIFKLNIYLNNINEVGSTLYLKYSKDKMTPCDQDGNVVSTADGTSGTNTVKKVVSLEDKMDYSDAGGDFFVNTETGELYCAFQIKTGEITTETQMCTITFKITKDNLKISDISDEDFIINSCTDDMEYYTSIGEIYADESPEYFVVERFDFESQPTVTGLEISGIADSYFVGDKLALDSITVKKKYSDNTSDETGVDLESILSDTNYIITINTNSLTADTTLNVGDILKIAYNGEDKAEGTTPTASITLNVREKKIVSLEIQGLDGLYKQDDTINLDDVTVVATDEKGDSRILNSNEYELTATGNSIVDNEITLTNSGTTTITATYKGENVENPASKPSATKTITISEKQLTGIEITAPTKDTYTVGETLDLTGLTVTATYNNNGTTTTESITTGYTTTINSTTVQNGTPLANVGVQTITVNYNGQTSIFDVVVFPTKLVGTEGNDLSTVVAEGFTWVNGSAKITVGEGEYALKYTNTYSSKEKTCNVKVLGIPTNLTATYGETLENVKYNGTAGLPTGFAWVNTSTLVGNVGDQTHNITYTGYTDLSATVTVNRKILTKEDLTYTMPEERQYDGTTATTVDVTAPAGSGEVTVKYYKDGEASTTATTTTPVNAGTYKVIASVAEGANYTALTETELDGSFTITKGTLVKDNFDVTDMPERDITYGTPVDVKATPNVIGAGNTVTVKYYKKENDETETEVPNPTAVGTYIVKVNINEGTNFFAADGTEGKLEIELGTFSITKKQLTKDDIDFTAPTPNIYDGTPKTPTVAIKSSVVGAGTVTVKYYKDDGTETEVPNPTDAGLYKVKITTTDGTNYDNVTDLEVGVFEIEKAEPTYTLPTDLTATYGDELSSVILPDGFTWEDSGKVGDAGTRTHTVKYTPEDKNNYKEVTELEVAIEVAKADLVEENFALFDMPTNNTKEYDGDPVTITSKIKDIVLGADDIRNDVTVEYYKDGAKVTDTSDCGTYEVKVSVEEGNNYNAVNELKIGEFSITKATLEMADITVYNPENNVYDGTPKIPTINIPEDGAGTVKDIKYYIDGTETEVTNPTDAGIYKVKITTENATNYKDITDLTDVGAFEIKKAEIPVERITVTADEEKTYNGKPSIAIATLDTTTLPGADDVTIDVTYVDKDGIEITNPTDAGTYKIKISSTGGANYKSLPKTEMTEKIIINKVTLSKDNIQYTLPESLVYDNTSKKATIVVEKDLGEGKTLTVDAKDILVKYEDEEGNIVEDPINAGTYTINLSVPAGKNYKALKETTVTTYEVEKATLTANDFTREGIPTGGSKEYDGNAVTVTASQNANITETLKTEVQYYLSTDTEHALLNPPSGIGTYIVKLKVTEGTNYKAADIELETFTIRPKEFDPSRIKYTNTAEYDGTNKDANTVNITIDGDNEATIQDVTFYQEDENPVNARNVGTYTVKADITTTECGHVGFIEIGTFEITKKSIEIKIKDKTIEYGQELTTIEVNEDVDICTGDNINDIITYKLSDKTVGEQTIIGEVKDTETANNYNVTFTNGKCKIKPKAITVTIGNTSSEYTGKEPAMPNTSELISVEPTDLVNGDTVDSLGITLEKEEGTDVGDYEITGNATTTNYKVNFIEGSFTITKGTLVKDNFDLTDMPESGITYGTPIDIKATPNVIGAGNTVTVKYYKKENDETEIEVTNPTAVGTYIVKVNINEGTNFFAADGIELGTFSITKKELTKDDIDLTAPTPNIYDGTEKSAIVAIKSSVVGAGTINSIKYYKDGVETNPINAGEYTVKITTADGTNYNNATDLEVGTFTIEKAEPTYTLPTGLTATYGDELSSVTLPDGFTWEDSGKVGDAGTRTHTVKYMPTDSNYKEVTGIEVEIEVAKADPVYSIEELTAAYGDTLGDVELPDGFTWDDATTTLVGNTGKHTFKVTFTPNDTANYNTLTNIDATVNVEKAIPSYIKPTGLEGYEKQPLSSIDITEIIGFSWTDSTTTLPLVKDNGDTFNTTMTFTPADTDNYKIVENIPVQVRVKENEIKAIRVSSRKEDGSNPEYYEGQTFEREDILVEAEWVIGGWQSVTDYTIVDEKRSLTTSDNKMVINYAGKTAEQSITVKPDEVADVTITPPSKLNYKYGDTIDLTGATITKVWVSGLVHESDTIPMTKDMLQNDDISDFDNINVLGQKGITVTAFGKTINNAFQITVNDVVVGIEIEDKTKLQTEYQYGDSINVTNKNTGAKLYVLVKYAGGTPDARVELTNAMVSGYSMTTVQDNQTVTVTHLGKTDTFEINVKDKVTGIDITKEPAKKLYKLNEGQSFGDIEVTNVMASGLGGTKLTASEYTISGFDSTTVGEKTITVTKNGTTHTDTFKVKVIDTTTDMYISALPKQTYNYGEGLSLVDGNITVKTQGNTTGTVIPMTNSSVTVTGYNPNKLGDQTLTVTYTYTEETETGMETKTLVDTYSVKVEDYEKGYTVTPPTKITYDYGMSLDLTGATVSKVWASGKTTDATEISGGMISGYSATTVGTQTIKVNAFGKENVGNFTVTVVDKILGISMKKQPNKIEYTQGEAIDVSGAVLNVTKQSGIKEIPVTKEMISGYDPEKTGIQVVTVTYGGKTTTFPIAIKPRPVTQDKPTNPSNPRPNRPTTPSIIDSDKYTVTFLNYDGTVLKTEEVERGQSATAPEIEKRDGYKFKGWDKLFDEIKEDTTVKAQYEEIKRAKVKTNGSITVEQGEEPDLSKVKLEIFDEDGEKIDEIPVTMDMISEFNPDKIGTQTITVTYTGEDGFEYTDTFKIKVVKPTETLGVKDEVKETKTENTSFLPFVAGISGAVGLLLALLAVVSNKNVEIYALIEDKRKLVGKQKISKDNAKVVLDKYEKELKNANIEIVLNKNITKKLNGEMVNVVLNERKAVYKVEYRNNEEFIVRMKNAD